MKELERRVHTDMKVAFSMYPTSIQELMAIADADEIMPPKSTWFEPKLRAAFHPPIIIKTPPSTQIIR